MGSRSRVLLVEDEALIAMMLQEWLTELGYETIGPVDAVDIALHLIETAQPLHAALLDISLGQLDCYPIADELRNHGIPYAFTTGHRDPGIPAQHRAAPVLHKPFNFQTTANLLVNLLLRDEEAV